MSVSTNLCFDLSFEDDGDYDSKNLILQADSLWAKDHHLDFHPTITINDFTYRGDIEFSDIREAICAAYQKRPQHCNLDDIWAKESTVRPYEEHNPEKENIIEDKQLKTLKVYHVFMVIIVICIVFFFTLRYFQRKTRRDNSEEIN